MWTTWSDWKDGTEGVKYRDRIVDFIEVEGLRIPASEVKAWGINGIYKLGHVILEVALNRRNAVAVGHLAIYQTNA